MDGMAENMEVLGYYPLTAISYADTLSHDLHMLLRAYDLWMPNTPSEDKFRAVADALYEWHGASEDLRVLLYASYVVIQLRFQPYDIVRQVDFRAMEPLWVSMDTFLYETHFSSLYILRLDDNPALRLQAYSLSATGSVQKG